ncbi:hypothetical protein GGR58DRAFT_525178 [Xylaria digitata]|nr:hypothetical protein GGR58DRAFT_525178 [Xylaria digitata]
MSTLNVEIKPLPSGADTEARKVASWLLSKDANFQVVEDVDICKNTKELATMTSNLLELFANEIQNRIPRKAKPLETRVTAIHFNRSTIVPLEQGWMMELIPIHVEGAVVVGDRPLDPDSYFHLTQHVKVSGDFFGLLLLSRLP